MIIMTLIKIAMGSNALTSYRGDDPDPDGDSDADGDP